MPKRIFMLAVMMGAATLGCAEPPPTDETAPEEAEVASAMLASGVKLQIVALQDGSFLATQSGTAKTPPAQITKTMRDSGDPVALFQQLAPGQPVPPTLIAAHARSIDLSKKARARGPARIPEGPTQTRAPRVETGPEFLFNHDNSMSNWTGHDGCPREWFDRHFCQNEATGDDIPPNPWCVYDNTWAYMEHPQGKGGFGAACANGGQITFRITAGTVHEYTVDQGSWRSGTILQKGTCGFFGCEDVKYFLRFEIVYRQDEHYGHLRASIDY